ncbi:MAG: zinc-ribbon domain-containing protein [Methanobrevibacter sp.]|uniref:zinc ribbon domain-containing protein n=1 Tax=Methanobrevibacter sp. TaxID=66852 RepID=UPI002B209180|nr:zinc-ribbon domain-containing protein [Methanobrevibacter sp.]MEA4957828.1 zinc-ribbon domain-containing protein [Methanobrevibacter sp.]
MTKYCPSCGEENEDNSLFCGNCGKRLSKTHKRNNKFLILAVGLLLIAIAIIGFYAFVTLNNSNESIQNNLINSSNALEVSLPTIYTDKVPIGSNTEFSSDSKKLMAITSSDNFVITMTQKFEHSNFEVYEDPFVGYLTISPRSSDIKVISIEAKQGNGIDGFYWQKYNIDSKDETSISLGENIIANVYQDGNWGQLTYIIRYEKT